MAQPFMQSSSLSIERLRTQFSLCRKGRAPEQSPTLTAHFCSSSTRPTRGNGYGVGYGVVIVPLALTVIWTGGSGLVAGGWGLVPSALKIAPCAGQLNCPLDALYLTGTPACVQACSTATKLPLLIWTSQLAWPSAGLVKATAVLVAWVFDPITVPVGVGVMVGGVVAEGCGMGVFVGDGGCVAVGDPVGVAFLCGHLPLPSSSPSLALVPTPSFSFSRSFCGMVEMAPSSPPCEGGVVIWCGDRAKLIPPTVTTVITPAV